MTNGRPYSRLLIICKRHLSWAVVQVGEQRNLNKGRNRTSYAQPGNSISSIVFPYFFHIIQLISVHIPCILPCFNLSSFLLQPSPPLSFELPCRADKHRSSCSNLAPPPRWTSGSHFGENSRLKP